MNLGPGLLPAAARPDIFAKGIILVQRRSESLGLRYMHTCTASILCVLTAH